MQADAGDFEAPALNLRLHHLLDAVAQAFSVCEDLVERRRADHVSKRGLSVLPNRMLIVLHPHDGIGRIADPHEDDSVQ